MSNWRSKNSNKKSDPKPIETNNSTSLVSSKQTEINDETSNVLKNPKALKDSNPSTSKHIQKFFCFGSPMADRGQTSMGWEQLLDQEFQSLDIDADGYLSIADLQCVLKNFSHLCNSNEIILRIFKELDLNHDQRISKQEFKLYKNSLLNRENRLSQSISNDKLTSIFTLFDRNQDNYISPQEIRETMRNLGEHIDDQLLNEMMQTADIDHDGRISRDEFEKLLLQLHRKS